MSELFYFVPQDKAITVAEVRFLTGIEITSGTSNSVLNRSQLYRVNVTENTLNPLLYSISVSYVINGEYADQVHTGTDLPLATAKLNGKKSERDRANKNIGSYTSSSGYTPETLTAAASQLVADRGADVESVVALQQGSMDRLDTNLQTIDSAADVASIATVVDAPDLVVNTGRGISGNSLDINPSYFPTINLVGVIEADLELYLPAVDRTLGYRTNLPSPYKFDSNADAFTADNFRVIVRIAATGVVLGEFICPDTGLGSNVDVDIFTGNRPA